MRNFSVYKKKGGNQSSSFHGQRAERVHSIDEGCSADICSYFEKSSRSSKSKGSGSLFVSLFAYVSDGNVIPSMPPLLVFHITTENRVA